MVEPWCNRIVAAAARSSSLAKDLALRSLRSQAGAAVHCDEESQRRASGMKERPYLGQLQPKHLLDLPTRDLLENRSHFSLGPREPAPWVPAPRLPQTSKIVPGVFLKAFLGLPGLPWPSLAFPSKGYPDRFLTKEG